MDEHGAGSGGRARRRVGLLATLAAAVAFIACGGDPPGEAAFARARGRAAPAEREWRGYLGGLESRQWSPLDEIDRSNVHLLERAWIHRSGEPASSGLQMQVNPIVVGGVLYGVSPNDSTGRPVFASIE